MKKTKTITELRGSLFETFEEVVSGEDQIITHKNGKSIMMVPISKIEELEEQVEIHKNLAIGYAQAIRGEGATSEDVIKRFRTKSKRIAKNHQAKK